jgi:hypothetical protein
MIRIDKVPIDKIKKNPSLYPANFDRGGMGKASQIYFSNQYFRDGYPTRTG